MEINGKNGKLTQGKRKLIKKRGINGEKTEINIKRRENNGKNWN